MIDGRIPLAGRGANVMNNILKATRSAEMVSDMQSEARLRDLFATHGEGIMRGDKGALAALAAIDPMAAARFEGLAYSRSRRGAGPSGPVTSGIDWLSQGRAPQGAPSQNAINGLSFGDLPPPTVSTSGQQAMLGVGSPLEQGFAPPPEPHTQTAGVGFAPSDATIAGAGQGGATPAAVQPTAAVPTDINDIPVQPGEFKTNHSPKEIEAVRSDPEAQSIFEQYPSFDAFVADKIPQLMALPPKQRKAAQSELSLLKMGWPEKQERKTMADRNGVQRYTDTGEEVFAGIESETKEKDRRIIDGADGFKYYEDTKERVLPGVSVPPEDEDSGPSFKDKQDFRKEFNGLPVVKNFREQVSGIKRVQTAANQGSAAGDLALIFAFMKVQDPTSVVREFEFATAEQAAAWAEEAGNSGVYIPRSVMSAIRKTQSGERLSDVQKADFVNTALAIYKGSEQNYDGLISMYSGIAERAGMPVEDVIVDYRMNTDHVADPDLISSGEGLSNAAKQWLEK